MFELFKTFEKMDGWRWRQEERGEKGRIGESRKDSNEMKRENKKREKKEKGKKVKDKREG